MEKRKLIFYWIFTGLMAFGMTSSGIMQLLKTKEMQEMMLHLGYPTYLLTLLGVWKLLGVLTVLVPGFLRIKEWAYAGLFFVMSGAFVSHVIFGDGPKEIIGPLMQSIFILLSWYLRPANRRL